MKDLTHYFQAPKSTSNGSETPPERTASKCKRKAGESVELKDTKSSALRNGDSPEEEIFKSKKPRKGNVPSKKKSAKVILDDISVSDNISADDTPVSKRIKKCNGNITNDSMHVKKVRTYSKKKPLEVIESDKDISFDGMNFNVQVLLTDCLKADSPDTKTNLPSEPEEQNSDSCFISENNTKKSKSLKLAEPDSDSCFVSEKNTKENKSLKSEEPDSDSCFVSDKKTKKHSKSKSDKEDEPGKNNLFNYFSKVDKIENKNLKNHSNVITVQAIVHSPPKEKNKLMKERDPNLPVVRQMLPKKSKKKKGSIFDDIKVIEEVTKVDDTNPKNSELIPTTPQPQIENVSPENSSSKGKNWKMRVKLNPSSKLETGLAKSKKSSKSKEFRKIVIASDSSDDEIVENKCEDELSDNDVEFVSESKAELTKPEKVEKSQPIKLAPLFCKKNDSKNTSDKIPVMDEAKRLFLESGVPEAIKKKMEEQKNIVEDDYKGEYVFPKCNHIQQKDPESFVWNLKECFDFKMKEFTCNIQTDQLSGQLFPSLMTNNAKMKLDQNNVEKFEFDLKDEINALKKQEPNANVNDIHSSIKRLKKVSESLNDICWTEKYKPFLFNDMIGNTTSLHQLKEWIDGHKKIKQIFLESDCSSGGEFVDSDDSCNSTDVKNNIAILVGPPGCGKTCAVYMLAHELGFKVLEINAGSNRAGKKIIDELLEATQSHRVKRTSDSLFNSKPEKSQKKKKRKETKKDKKTMSLILVEDADILFENHDEGFLSALNSLTSLSKRPLIFTVNNLNYPHLYKYNNSQNLILRFDYPSRASINVWLKVIALIEGVQLTDEALIELHKIAGSDLRKNLLQLQMLIQSKYRCPKSTKEQLFYQDWFSHVRCLGDKKNIPKLRSHTEHTDTKLFSDDEISPTNEFKEPSSKDKITSAPKSKAELLINRKALLESAKFLDYAARLDNFTGDTDQKIHPSESSLSKYENYSTYRINSDIDDFIRSKIFEKYEEKAPFSFKKYYNAVVQNSRIKTIIENVFLSFNPKISNLQAKYCDYLPIIRHIARSEKNKATPLRRSNRYFGYLKSVNIDITDKETEILCSTLL